MELECFYCQEMVPLDDEYLWGDFIFCTNCNDTLVSKYAQYMEDDKDGDK